MPLLLRADKNNSVRSVIIQRGAVELSCMKKSYPVDGSIFVAARILWAKCNGHIKNISLCPWLKLTLECAPSKRLTGDVSSG